MRTDSSLVDLEDHSRPEVYYAWKHCLSQGSRMTSFLPFLDFLPQWKELCGAVFCLSKDCVCFLYPFLT